MASSIFSEVEKFPCEVLSHRWPDVPNLGDMTKIDGTDWKGKIDVLVGGTPCQSFSVAGLRKGLEDERGNLSVVFARLARDINPDFIVWENVPGVLSDKTNAFGCLLGALAGEDDPLQPPGGKWTNAGFVLGPERAIAWRVLDAQYFGVAQRRRRVFLVACPRDGADPRAILFEYEGLRRDTAPSREAGKGVADATGGSLESGCTGNNRIEIEEVIPLKEPCKCLSAAGSVKNALHGEPIDPSFTLNANWPQGVEVAFTQNQCGDVLVTPHCPSIGTNSNATGRNTPKVMAFDSYNQTVHDVSYTLRAGLGGAGDVTPKVFHGAMQVRRLTPTECERLQGMPDGHTQIPWRGKPAEDCPDGPRYKAIGNSMAVPCMRWIGQRIALA